DVAVLHGIAVVLEHDGAGRAGVAAHAGRGVVLGDLHLIVDLDAVVVDGDDARLFLLAAFAHGSLEFDVVALPDRGGLAGIDERGGHAVDAAAIVVLALETVAVEDLHLVAALDVDAAVTAALPARLGHVGDAKLDVQ